MFVYNYIFFALCLCHYIWRHLEEQLEHIAVKAIASQLITETRRAKLAQIQGGLQRASQDSTKGGL